MNDDEWDNYDAELLTSLGNARQRVDLTMGSTYNVALYKSIAARLSVTVGAYITSRDVAKRAARLRQIFNSCRNDLGTYMHPVIDANLYQHLLERCFLPPPPPPVARAVQIPRSLTTNRSGRSRQSLVWPAMLVHLHAQHRHRFDSHKLARFSKFLVDNPGAALVFSRMEDHNQILEFIDDIHHSNYES